MQIRKRFHAIIPRRCQAGQKGKERILQIHASARLEISPEALIRRLITCTMCEWQIAALNLSLANSTISKPHDAQQPMGLRNPLFSWRFGLF
jgi:hypothetical protein